MAPKISQITDYQYSLYRDYLEQLDGIMTKYGQQTGLGIEYWHIKVDESKNFDDLKIQNSYKHYVYDLYHFIPTINMTPLTYQMGYDPQYQGTSNIATGSFSMYLVEAPLPGDIFRFYPYDGATDRTELFRVTTVKYMRTSKNMLGLYQVDFESAPMYVETIEHVRINEIFCWDTERHEFIDEEACGQLGCISACRDILMEEINKWYDEQNGWYGKCSGECSGVDWENLCIPEPTVIDVELDEITYNPGSPMEPSEHDCPDGPDIENPSEWPPGPGWPGWPEDPNWICSDGTNDDDIDDGTGSDDNNTGNLGPSTINNMNPGSAGSGDVGCGSGTTRPLVFLNTILKRLKKLFEGLDVKPIYGVGTAKIPIEWIMPYYAASDPGDPTKTIWMQRDYWDTWSCLSFDDLNSGELFDVTQILAGECEDCPSELVEEIECHRELYLLVTALVLLMKPLMSTEELKDRTCDRKCCDGLPDGGVEDLILRCQKAGSKSNNDLFWDYAGADAGSNAPKFHKMYENALNIPLYLTFRDGAIWPDGGRHG